MMRLEFIIVAAFLLDLALGDPKWIVHPVRLIGGMAFRLEKPARKLFSSERFCGVIFCGFLVTITGVAAWLLLWAAGFVHPLLQDAVSVFLIYTAIAGRDLALHSRAVYKALCENDIPEARKRVGFIVGRDTADMNESDMSRAAVESVAENTVDGVTGPLLFAVIAGPIGAMVYKAASTLDSMVGYKNERYEKFGWASARLDDLLNYFPARITAPLMCIAGGFLGMPVGRAFKIFLRDRKKHSSPNAGLPEAAAAGALGLQLGGVSFYSGRRLEKPLIGDDAGPLEKGKILEANRLMFVTSAVFLIVSVLVRFAVLKLWQMGRS